jgi:hypothetical protein
LEVNQYPATLKWGASSEAKPMVIGEGSEGRKTSPSKWQRTFGWMEPATGPRKVLTFSLI